MRYRPLPASLFAGNRQRLAALLRPSSLALLNANDIMPTSADGSMRFRQNSDLYYLTGIDQEETVLLLFPDAPDAKNREILFLRETSEHIATWEGYKYTKEHARQASGIANVQWLGQFEGTLRNLIFEAEHLYLNTNEHTRAQVQVQTRDARFIEDLQRRFPLHRYERLAPLLHRLRAIKQPSELEALQEAIRITHDGFLRLARTLRPGIMEYELEAELLHEFVRQGSRGFAYEPIIASGPNACVLHYVMNDRPCQPGDVVLFDVAAEYANYNADLTRCLPVSGRFTPRQRQVYDAVLRVFREACKLLVPGTLWDEYHLEVGKIMEGELLGLGLLSRQDIKNQNPDWPAYKKYFMHGTSHFLGLDVHDVGSKYRRFEPGMVFTCEPGIYIPEEGLGIRLENNLLITEDGNRDLMAEIPIEADAIEALMNP